MAITWWMFALASTVFWGLFYILISRIMTVASPVTVYWLPMIPLTIALPFYYKTLVEDYHAIMASTGDVKLSVAVASVASIVASLLFYRAIQMSDSTSASLIQISYPFFVALFAFILFNENQLTPAVLTGGLMIAAGTGIIIYNT